VILIEKTKEESQILRVENLSVDYKSPTGNVHALRNVSLTVEQGEVLSVVGESGSGKTTLALAVSRLLSPNSAVLGRGKILFRGEDLARVTRSEMDKLRGTEIFMIFQNPFMSLNPLMKIKDQISEAIRVRDKRTKNKETGEVVAREVVSVLKSVRIGDAEDVMKRYPHQLSGGQNQRVMLAMAVAERPSLLIADEPTTALDVTTQAQVLSLLKEIIKKTGMSVVFITHDLAVAGSISDKIAVLYGGMVQEIGSSKQVLSEPKHPYTASLIKSIPSKTKREGQLDAIRGSFSLSGVENMCAFVPRCPLAHDACMNRIPALINLGSNNYVRCVNYGEAEEDSEI
jgi:peptide/nickel transport system ATP-binding protein